jgi:oxygen-independent coproporphyrinogen-3 oxidase
MAGIYVHIPYCKQACTYCDFHFSTAMNTRNELVPALVMELSGRQAEIKKEIASIYFGGGTPSLLEPDELARILDAIHQLFTVANDAEITLEANPDDLDVFKLNAWMRLGVNRLSIGIQSFHDADLVWMNRAHTASEAQNAVDRARDAGFTNLTVDLIYGLPRWVGGEWEANLERLLALQVPHFSAYILTVEDRTVLGRNVAKGKQRLADDAVIAGQYGLLCSSALTAGYAHYEVSNFAHPHAMAKHNAAYWTGHAYLGIGPGAHSFDGSVRRWNISSNRGYIQAIAGNRSFSESETLTPIDRHNEQLLTGLRTARGIALTDFSASVSPAEHPDSQHEWSKLLAAGDVTLQPNGRYRIPEARWLFADQIAGSLFVVDHDLNA